MPGGRQLPRLPCPPLPGGCTARKGLGSSQGAREPGSPSLTITVISCLEGSRGLQVAAQGPVAAVTVVEAAVDVHRVLGVGGGWQ